MASPDRAMGETQTVLALPSVGLGQVRLRRVAANAAHDPPQGSAGRVYVNGPEREAVEEHGADETRPRVLTTPAEIAHAMLMLTMMEPPHADCALCKRLAERFAV